MRKMLHFLGGVYFAVILIGLLAIVVIAATFIESHYNSHEIAVNLIYQNPLFNVLLGGFFVNILLSALRRYPFKAKHAPFIITHIGLLMIISGTIYKNIHGIQGSMQLFEGSASNLLQVSNSQAIHVDNSSYDMFDFTTPNNLGISLKRYIPHTTFRYTSWVKSNGIDILGFPSIQNGSSQQILGDSYLVESIPSSNLLDDAKAAYEECLECDGPYRLAWSENPTINEIPLTGFYRHIDPKYFSSYTGKKPQLLSLKNTNRLLFFHNRDETLVCLIRKDGSLHLQRFSSDKIDSYFAYNEGREGYSLQCMLPNDLFLSLEERLNILFQNLDSANIDIIKFLWKWQGEGSWLSENGDFDIPTLTSDPTLGAWSKVFIPHIEDSLKNGTDPFIKLQNLGWGKPSDFDHKNSIFEKLQLVQEQLYSLSDKLPPIEVAISKSEAASAFLRSSRITFDTLFKELKPIDLGFRYLESPLGYVIESSPNILNKPAVVLECIQDGLKETICIPFNETLNWPILNGTHLISFKLHQIQIPYKVRLKQARKLCNPSTNTPNAYEADVVIDNTPFTLKMNQVFESDDGYRFYLASLSDNPSDAKQVVIVINYDPVRYTLTYPGGLLIVAGAFLLFFRKKKL